MEPRARVAALAAVTIIAAGAASPASDVAHSEVVGSGMRTRASWYDEFRGPAGSAPNRKHWSFDTGATGWGNGELQRYTKSRANSRLDGRGHLVILARHRSGSGLGRGSFTSARLKTAGKFAFRYGRIAMRAKLPRGRGLWPAFWMLGSGFPRLDWPFCGEIDVMEYLGHQPRLSYGYVHGPGSLSDEGVGGEHRSRSSLADQFHVFAADWTAAAISFSVDGRTFETVRRADYPPGQTWAFDRRMFLLVNLAVGGEWPGRPSRTTRFPARMTVDWIRVWKAA